MRRAKLKKRVRRLREEPHPGRFLLMTALARTGVLDRVPLTVRFVDGLRMRLRPGAVGLWVTPDHPQLAEIGFLRAYLRPGDTFVDVGANVGRYTIAAARYVGPDGRVISFEPHPVVYRYMVENVELNELANVSPENCAVGAEDGEVLLSDAPNHDTNSVSTNGAGVPVRVRRMDDVVPAGTEVRLLKIDAEGYEKLVLEGAPATLENTECVYIEVGHHHAARFGYGPEVLAETLTAAGFELWRELDDGQLQPVDQGPPAGYRIENLFAVRDSADLLARTGQAAPAATRP